MLKTIKYFYFCQDYFEQGKTGGGSGYIFSSLSLHPCAIMSSDQRCVLCDISVYWSLSLSRFHGLIDYSVNTEKLFNLLIWSCSDLSMSL